MNRHFWKVRALSSLYLFVLSEVVSIILYKKVVRLESIFEISDGNRDAKLLLYPIAKTMLIFWQSIYLWHSVLSVNWFAIYVYFSHDYIFNYSNSMIKLGKQMLKWIHIYDSENEITFCCTKWLRIKKKMDVFWYREMTTSDYRVTGSCFLFSFKSEHFPNVRPSETTLSFDVNQWKWFIWKQQKQENRFGK